MPIKTETPTKSQINEIRKRFLERYERSPPAVPFHPVDMGRVKNEDIWISRFLEMYDLDIDVCVEKLWDTCIWREKYGANTLNENNLRKDYLMEGVIFARNKDVDGKPLLIFQTKLHTKGSKDMDEVVRVVVYWIERIHRETNMSQMTLVFDMDGTGLSNMDLDFIKRIIETFKMYYPAALNYILVFELAWMLNAAFKIVKGLLPAKAVEILKMISKKDINTYIDKDNCLKCWGGNDDYKFHFVPEVKVNGTASNGNEMTSPNVKENNNNNVSNNNNKNNNNNNNNNSNSIDKKVHFANSSPVRMPESTRVDKLYDPPDYNMLQINPNEFLVFSQGESCDTTIDLTSTSNVPVMYKIQTTSPEKFRVRPRCGVLLPNQSVSVHILLKAEHHLAESAKDKFLVMCTQSPPDVDLSTPQQVADVWKQKSSNCPDIEQHRLCCVYKNDEQIRNGQCGQPDATMNSKSTGNITELAKHAKRLERQLQYTQLLQYLTLFVLLIMSVAVVYLLRLEMDSGVLNPPSGSLPIRCCRLQTQHQGLMQFLRRLFFLSDESRPLKKCK